MDRGSGPGVLSGAGELSCRRPKILGNRSRVVIRFLLATLCALALVTPWQAGVQAAWSPLEQRSDGSSDQALSQAGSSSPDQVSTSSNERDVLEFVGKHQPKLRKLMEFLKQKAPEQYRQAVKEMTRSKQRLSNLEKRDTGLYKIELELWRTRSELRLLAAEMSVAAESQRNDLEKRLSQLAKSQVALELSKLKLQRQRTAEQLEQYDQQILDREAAQAEQATKIVKQWKNRIAKQSPRESQL